MSSRGLRVMINTGRWVQRALCTCFPKVGPRGHSWTGRMEQDRPADGHAPHRSPRFMCLTEDPLNLTLNHKHPCSWSAEIKGKTGGEGVNPPKMQSELLCPHWGSESLTQSDAGGKEPLGLSQPCLSLLSLEEGR